MLFVEFRTPLGESETCTMDLYVQTVRVHESETCTMDLYVQTVRVHESETCTMDLYVQTVRVHQILNEFQVRCEQ